VFSHWVAVGAGGAMGALLRFWVTESMPSETMPMGTLTANLLGSLLLGSVVAALAANTLTETQALLFGTGLLGAFTTMSTFSMETVTMWQEKEWSAMGTYVLLTVILCPVLAFIGWKGTTSFLDKVI